MTRKITVSSTGEGTRAALPPEVMRHLNITEGDTLYAVETEVGVLLTPLDPELQETLDAFEILNAKYSNTFRALAK